MSFKSSSNVAALAAGAIVGAILYCLVRSASQSTNSRSTAPNAFFLGVKVVFPSEDDKHTFRTDFENLAKFVREFEPQTLSYELLQSDKDPLHMYILERYKDKRAYLDIHKQSKPFLEFRARFQKMIEEKGVLVDGQSYLETGIGFL